MIESKACCDKSDGDGINSNIYPSAVVDSKPQVEHKSQKKTPCRHRSLSTANRWVSKSSPCVVDNQGSSPLGNSSGFVDGFHPKSDHYKANCDEDRVAEDFIVESIDSGSKCRICYFKGEQPSPRDVLEWCCQGEHVQYSH